MKTEKTLMNISRKISYLLRHNPEDLNIDREGWVNTSDLLNKLNITITELDFIVNNNDKKRFGFNEDKSKIRARQGHSKDLNVNLTFNIVKNPKLYYHGTILENILLIEKNGLIPKSRTHVHLSKDVMTAINVGSRHNKNKSAVIVLEIDGWAMKRDGLSLYESENGVILADEVPSKYIKRYVGESI